MKYLAVVFAASITATSAFSQTAPVATPETAAPRYTCAKPEMLDTSRQFTESQMSAFIAALNRFKECAEGYAQAQQKEAERVQKAAQANAQALVAAGNAAIKEYNDFVEEANKVIKAKPQAAPMEPPDARRQGNADTAPPRNPGRY